jgi:hypothetical protein
MLYVIINAFVRNARTKHEMRRPFELSINLKNMGYFRRTILLAQILSAVFRKDGDVTITT